MSSPGSEPKAKPSSVAGGAHYHLVTATAKWKTFVEAMDAKAKHTAAERERRELERKARDKYHRGPDQQ